MRISVDTELLGVQAGEDGATFELANVFPAEAGLPFFVCISERGADAITEVLTAITLVAQATFTRVAASGRSAPKQRW
jgi:hypothetical protein